jgi:hypothetical protein
MTVENTKNNTINPIVVIEIIRLYGKIRQVKLKNNQWLIL